MVQVLHDLWINEGYTSPAFLAATNATFPAAALEARQLACKASGLCNL